MNNSTQSVAYFELMIHKHFVGAKLTDLELQRQAQLKRFQEEMYSRKHLSVRKHFPLAPDADIEFHIERITQELKSIKKEHEYRRKEGKREG